MGQEKILEEKRADTQLLYSTGTKLLTCEGVQL